MTDSDDEKISASVGFHGWNAGSLSSETSEGEDQEGEDEPDQKKRKLDYSDSESDSDNDSDSSDNTQSSYAVSKTATMSSYNPLAAKLMEKMGYKEGKGLGKNQQGRTGIIEASKQRGRRGLGLEVKGFEQNDEATWDFESDQVTVDERVDWLPTSSDPVPELETMKSWIKIDRKPKDVPLVSEFCSDEMVKKVVECKSVFDDLENEEMRRARTKSNPYETIRGVIFQNRAAMKMANMDALLDFMFTNPKNSEGQALLNPDDLLYFADVCAGPGGFSEYVLWRRKCTAKGFGFTLKGACDFKLHEFHAAASELFEPHYGSEGDGDIYKAENLIAFREFVKESTEGKGVHFVMADGGFSVEGQENLQEIKSNRLYLCQFLCALSILRPEGHFVCKLFDIFTDYSVGLIYLMYLAFEQISIFKPVTSRPANSERYIICKGKRSCASIIHDYMFNINLKFEELSSVFGDMDVCEVVPLEVMKSNQTFTDYIIHSSERLGQIQCLNLEKIKMFAQNPNLHDMKQADVRGSCLDRWKIPDKARAPPIKEDNDAKYNKLTKGEIIDFQTQNLLTAEKSATMHSRYDYKFSVLGSDERCLILSAGRSQVFMWDGKTKWKKLIMKNCEVKLELPRDTLLEAELVYELKGEGKGQKKTVAIHVIDALAIYGEDLRHLSYELRISRARVFCKAVNKPTRSDLAPVYVKDQFHLCDLHEYFDRLHDRVLKGMGPQPRKCFLATTGKYFVPRGLLIIKIVKDPWMLAHSRSSGKIYYYNTANKQAVYEFPDVARLSYNGHMRQRMVWYRKDPMFENPMAAQCVSEDELIERLHNLPP